MSVRSQPMSKGGMMKTYKYDSEIADLVLSIMGNGTMVVETFNEALLCKYFEMRGTPLKTEKPYRRVSDDLETYEELKGE